MAHNGMQKCVLVVDDDPRSLKLMRIMLGKAGLRVVTADGGAEGLERLAAEQPDVVIADFLMPGMDGLEFCRRVRAVPGQGAVRMVLSTAMASADVVRKAKEAGVAAVLTKPFERAALLDTLHGLLGSDRDWSACPPRAE